MMENDETLDKSLKRHKESNQHYAFNGSKRYASGITVPFAVLLTDRLK